MAEQQKADTPPTEGQTQQTRSGRSSGRGASGATSMEGAQSGSPGSGGQNAQQGSDQERQRQVSREPSSTGKGMQHGGQSGGDSAISGRGQPSMLPAFMANPGLMASAFMSDPFAFAQVMSQEMDRLFDTFSATGQGGRGVQSSRSGRSLQQQGGRGQSYWAPQMEVFQRGNDMVVRADLPGVRPDDVQIDIEDGVLTISGERRQENEQQQEGYFRSERSYGTFVRSIALPEGVNEDQVNARFDHGVLEVDIPMPDQQRSRGRRVQIQSSVGSTQGAEQISGSSRAGSTEKRSSESQSGSSGSQSGSQGSSRSKSGESSSTT
jgi:HSP20 family protein